MKKKLFNLLALCFMASLFVSCSHSDDVEIRYLSVQLTDSKLWSIVDVETGELVCEDEFKNCPSEIVNGIFFVKNESGLYDYYNIKDLKKPINKESYVDVTSFNNHGTALAVKKGGTITIIDENCKVLKELDKSIKYCSQFCQGLAIYTNSLDQKGFINEKGEIIIKANYDYAQSFSEDGLTIVGKEDGSITKYSVIDIKGKIQFSFTSKEYESHGGFHEGALPVAKGNDGEDIFFLDKSGKKIGKFGKNNYSLWQYGLKGGLTVFNEGDLYGIKDKKAEIVIRAKYNSLQILKGDILIAEKENKYGLINKNDDVILPFEYDLLHHVKDDIFIAKNNKTYSLLDAKGNDIGKLNFVNVNNNRSSSVESNYFDAKGAVRNLIEEIGVNTCVGISKGTTLRSFKHLLTKSEYYYKNEYGLSDEKGDLGVIYCFNSSISREKYSYLYGYRFYEGVEFNYNARCTTIMLLQSLKKYAETAEVEFVKEFEKQIKDKGFEPTTEKKHYFKNKSGNYVAVGYNNEGVIVLYYVFEKGILLDVTRDARKESVSESDEYEIEECDSITLKE